MKISIFTFATREEDITLTFEIKSFVLALDVKEKILLAFCFERLIFTKSFGLRIRERKIRKEISVDSTNVFYYQDAKWQNARIASKR
jgi:hypothetical protein